MAKEADYSKLVKAAISALDSCYGAEPGSKHIYASAVLTDKGNTYTASNYGSYTASLTLHAEQAALSHAASHNDSRVTVIVCVSKEDSKGKEFCHPCGICKQLIWENSIRSGLPIKVVMANLEGKYLVEDIKALVPYPWPTKPE